MISLNYNAPQSYGIKIKIRFSNNIFIFAFLELINADLQIITTLHNGRE
jgi:hypothetical protein